MRHLHTVPALQGATPAGEFADLGDAVPGQIALALPGLPADPLPRTMPASEFDDDLPAEDPKLDAMLAQVDTLFDGLEGTARMDTLRTMYFDADGMPQARSQRLRAL